VPSSGARRRNWRKVEQLELALETLETDQAERIAAASSAVAVGVAAGAVVGAAAADRVVP
jgi:hypothetical protein